MSEPAYRVRLTGPEDFDAVIALTERIYPDSPPWTVRQLASHQAAFPEGQFVAEDCQSGTLVAMAASLIVRWDDYNSSMNWREFTGRGTFDNHDPVNGRTLYGAEIMVDPSIQGMGVGSLLYDARAELTRRLGLLRIRAGARLRGYHRYASQLTAREYCDRVASGEIRDPTLSFQLRHGFQVLDVVSGYLSHDPESLGWAALIEWLNPDLVPEKGAPIPLR